MASTEPPSPRTWAMVTTGIALASSAVTLVSVLGFQRFNRRRLRHDLEDNVRRSLQEQREKGGRASDSDQASRSSGTQRADSLSASRSGLEREHAAPTPRYLTAMAAQDAQLSRPGSPRASSATDGAKAALSHPRASTPNGPRPSALPMANRRLIQQARDYDESLIREQLSRNYSFLGDEAMHSLRQSFVIVVGAGGVGSWCALMLLRSGVGRLRLIDFDQVSLSSLNRHACATLADVGRPKVDVCKEKFAEIAPWCDVDARVDIFRASEAARLLGPAAADSARNLAQSTPTYIVDCIDNLDTKVDLLAFCYHHKIPCFSSMGAGAKADPSQIQVADLNTTAEDPLARRVRRGLRAKGIWGGGVMAKKTTKAKKSKKEKDDKEIAKKGGKEKAASKAVDEGSASASAVKKLEHSGRGAVEAAQRSTTRTSARPTPAVSRRTSSTSSAGSMYFSPASTPTDEDSNYEDDKQDRTIRGARLPDESDFNSSIATSLASSGDGERQASSTTETESKDNSANVRPSLATLQDPSGKDSPSRRASSLQELEAEEMRSRSGQAARGSNTTVNLATHAEEQESSDEEADNAGKDDQQSVRPYTIMCVYTNEKSDTRLLPLDEEEFKKGAVDELAALEDFRVRILPVLGPLPAMFGLAAATYIICSISGRELEPLPFKGRRKTAERFFMELENSERRYPSPGSQLSKSEMAVGPKRIPWSVEDVAYLFEEVYRCRSVVPPHETLSIGRILRWDSTLPLSYSNVALFSRAEGQRHEEEVLKHGRSPVEVWGEEASRMFKRRMAEERRMNVLR